MPPFSQIEVAGKDNH